MHKTIFLILFFVLVKFDMFSQEKLTWEEFANVKFYNVYSAIYDDFFLKPSFGSTIKSYQSKKIRIKGYFLDFSFDGDEFYMVSKNPKSSCFFCGAVGLESIVEVVFKQKQKFKTDQIVEITGVLELNSNDIDHCNYIIKEAVGKLID